MHTYNLRPRKYINYTEYDEDEFYECCKSKFIEDLDLLIEMLENLKLD